MSATLTTFQRAMLALHNLVEQAEKSAPYLDSLDRQKTVMLAAMEARQAIVTLKMLWSTR